MALQRRGGREPQKQNLLRRPTFPKVPHRIAAPTAPPSLIRPRARRSLSRVDSMQHVPETMSSTNLSSRPSSPTQSRMTLDTDSSVSGLSPPPRPTPPPTSINLDRCSKHLNPSSDNSTLRRTRPSRPRPHQLMATLATPPPSTESMTSSRAESSKMANCPFPTSPTMYRHTGIPSISDLRSTQITHLSATESYQIRTRSTRLRNSSIRATSGAPEEA